MRRGRATFAALNNDECVNGRLYVKCLPCLFGKLVIPGIQMFINSKVITPWT